MNAIQLDVTTYFGQSQQTQFVIRSTFPFDSTAFTGHVLVLVFKWRSYCCFLKRTVDCYIILNRLLGNTYTLEHGFLDFKKKGK